MIRHPAYRRAAIALSCATLLLAACDDERIRDLQVTTDATTLSVAGSGHPSQARIDVRADFDLFSFADAEADVTFGRQLAWVAGSAERFDGSSWEPVDPESVTIDPQGRTSARFDFGSENLLLFLRFDLRAAEPGAAEVEVEVRFGSDEAQRRRGLTVVP